MIDPRFGRARYFIVYDTDDDTWAVIDNVQNSQISHGAGVQTAQNVVDAGAKVAVSGNFGPKAADVLNAAGIETAVWSDGTVADVVELAKHDRLSTQV